MSRCIIHRASSLEYLKFLNLCQLTDLAC